MKGAHHDKCDNADYQVYVAPIIAMAGKDIPPGQSRSTWSPSIFHPHLRRT